MPIRQGIIKKYQLNIDGIGLIQTWENICEELLSFGITELETATWSIMKEIIWNITSLLMTKETSLLRVMKVKP